MSVPPEVGSPKAARSVVRGPRLRAATLQDYDQIALLEASHGLDAKSPEDWAHLWLDNPAYRDGWAPGWVVEDPRGAIVASVGNIPLLYELNGHRLIAASGRAQVADPAYHSATPLLLSRVIHQPGIDLYLNNTMMRSAAASFAVFECPRVPAGAWDQSAFWITDHAGFLRCAMEEKHRTGAARWMAGPAAALLSLRDRVLERRLRTDAEVVSCLDFDQRFDQFWEELRRRHPHLLLAARSSEMLRWHFGPALRRGEVWIAAVPARDGFAAYAVFDRKDNTSLGLKRMRLVDFVSLDGSTRLLAPIVRWALDRCRATGLHMLESVGRWLEYGGFMHTFAPHKRRLSTWTYFYRANRAELAGPLSSPRVWAPSAFDGNASL